MMTVDTDQELINQLTNLKREMVERMDELRTRGYEVTAEAINNPSNATFTIHVSKTIRTEEVI